MQQNENLLDEDFLFVPYIIEKSVLARVIDFVENVYDPMSKSQTVNLVNLLVTFINDYPTLNHQSTNTKKLIESIVTKIRSSLDEDLFLPLYLKQ